MDKVKIQEIADEAGLSNGDLLDKAKELGINVKAANSTINMKEAEILIDYATSGTLPKDFKIDKNKKPIKKASTDQTPKKIKSKSITGAKEIILNKYPIEKEGQDNENKVKNNNKISSSDLQKLLKKEKDIKSASNNSFNKEKYFQQIVDRITSQSYSYSDRNAYGKCGKISSVFIEKNNDSVFYYMPLFNYFEQQVSWVKVNAFMPIQLNKKFTFFNGYDIFTQDDILQKFVDGSIQNLVIAKKMIKPFTINNTSPDYAIYILNEVLYTKRIYLVLHFVVGSEERWVEIPIEGALSTRGYNILRTDEHGNHFSKEKYIEDNRFKIFGVNA